MAHTVTKYGEFTGIPNARLVIYASTLLRDSAATWWRHLELSVDENGLPRVPTSWAGFKTAFRNEFKPGNATQMARQRLQDLKQTGTIRDYIIAHRDIMLDLPGMHEPDAINSFVLGLQYEPRLQVLLKDPISVPAAYSYAEAYEAALERANGVRDSSPRASATSTYASEDI